jgi:hypothetical protein
MTKGASMKRALVFLVIGPVLVSTIATLAIAQAAGTPSPDIARLVAIALFFFTLPVAALAGTLDVYLARAFAIPLRAPLIAAIGAIIASGLAWILFSCLLPPPNYLPFFAIGGAACMGLCSLLANEYGWQGPAVQANSLLRN